MDQVGTSSGGQPGLETQMQMHVIQTNHLEKRFGRVRALRDVNLTVEPGSATALIGANGAGKSTLIRTLLNLYAPTRGSASVLGVDSRKLSPRELEQIGYATPLHGAGGSQHARGHAHLRS